MNLYTELAVSCVPCYYTEDNGRSCSSIPSTSPCNCSSYPSSYYLPTQSSTLSDQTNVCSDTHVVTFASDKRFGLIGIGRRGLERNVFCRKGTMALPYGMWFREFWQEHHLIRMSLNAFIVLNMWTLQSPVGTVCTLYCPYRMCSCVPCNSHYKVKLFPYTEITEPISVAAGS